MKITKPKPGESFSITSGAEWPSIQLETDATGPHTWKWSITWGSFSKSGTATTSGNQWDAREAIAGLGGKLTVTACANNTNASISLSVVGKNPSSQEVVQYLAGKPNSTGFDRILEHESKFKQFKIDGQPVKSFDGGYGMCQLTEPTPTFEQVWNWKRNVDGGLALFAQKRAAAVAYLSQSGRSYTAGQLTSETVCRWNGGSYHDWDATKGAWVRRGNILCDSTTGNIGWDTGDPENAGKTEAELHHRDEGSYSAPPGAGAHWKYSGICYADKLLG